MTSDYVGITEPPFDIMPIILNPKTLKAIDELTKAFITDDNLRSGYRKW